MRNRNIIHPATVFFLLWWLVAIISWIGSIYAWNGVKNIISTEALRWFLRYSEERLMSSPVLYIAIIFFMSVGLFVHSGLGGVLWRIVRHERKLSGKEKKSLVASALIAVAYFIVYALLAWGPWNIVRGVTGRYVDSPLHDGASGILALGLGLVSMMYGYSADHFRSDTDVVKGMSYLFSRFPSYLVSLFFVINFVTAFDYSGLAEYIGMTREMFDIAEWICCFLPVIWEFCLHQKIKYN